MDRRTVLAFLMIFLVITGYQILMSREAQNRQPAVATPERAAPAAQADAPVFAREAGESGTAVSAPDASRRAADEPWRTTMTAESALAPIEQGLVEPTITVRTPLYVIELAGRGARVSSWLGLEYLDRGGEPVQLVPQADLAVARGLDAIVFGATEIALGELMFATAEPAEVALSRGSRTILFTLRTAGDLEVRKTYTFEADSYEISIDLELAAVGSQAPAARSVLGAPQSMRFGWAQGIASTERGDRLEEVAFRSFAGVGDALEIRKRGSQIKNVDKVHGTFSGNLRFAGLQNKYFTIVGLPARDAAPPHDATVVLSGDPARNLQTWTIELPAQSGLAGSDAQAAGRLALYIGPQKAELLKAYGVGLEKTMDLGWALVRPLTEATLWIMAQMRRIIPNYGVIIIVFSVLTKIAFYPLTRSSTQSMKRMQQLQPKIKELQEKHKDNREKLSQEMMKLYKKEKINPMAGCLPLLLQMPVFIALYQALAHTIALRNTPFFGWIDDLSKPDALFTLPFSLPFLGADFNLLPLLMTATMVVQMRMTPTGTAPAQMAMMNTLMPVIFLFFFYQMPSGLVLYWLVNNVVTIYQTWRIHKTATAQGGS